jgi:hypothetical protein
MKAESVNDESKALRKTDVSDCYLHVLKLVKNGMTMQDACVASGVERNKFGKGITKEQKKELKFYKATNSSIGTFGRFGTRDFITLEADEDNV